MRGAGLLAVSLALAACAAGPSIPPSKLSGWHVVSTPTFRLAGPVPPDELRRLADDLALFEATFARIARRPVASTSTPTSVYLLGDDALLRRFGLGPGTGVAGWMFATLEGCFATVAVRPSHADVRHTLLHEYTHALLRRQRRAPLPSWYDEGLSTFFMTVSERDGAVIVGAAPAGMLAWVSDREPLPLERLFGSTAWSLRGREIVDYYATAWALSHLLLTTPAGRSELSRFAAQLEKGVPWRDAFTAAFDRSPERLQQSLARHVATLARRVPVEALLDANELAVPASAAPAPLAPEQVAYELGFLTLQGRQDDAGPAMASLARRLLEIAASGEAPSARADAALAESQALDGDAKAASARIERALARTPDDARVQLHAGRVALARAESLGDAAPERAYALGTAEQAFALALAAAPDSAAAWAGLGRARRADGRAADAVTAFENARTLGWSDALDLELGALYLERGRRDDAYALLWPLAQDLHRGETGEHALELLEEAGLLRDDAGAGAR
jgi:hypothetical protein